MVGWEMEGSSLEDGCNGRTRRRPSVEDPRDAEVSLEPFDFQVRLLPPFLENPGSSWFGSSPLALGPPARLEGAVATFSFFSSACPFILGIVLCVDLGLLHLQASFDISFIFIFIFIFFSFVINTELSICIVFLIMPNDNYFPCFLHIVTAFIFTSV